MAKNQDDKVSKKEITRIARDRFKLAEEAWSDNRKQGLDDLKFRAGDQWPEKVKAEREREDRPCLTINRMPQQVRQVTNDQRQNRPKIKVSPVDDNADIDTAKLYQGLIRHIEVDSNSDAAIDTAFEGAVTKGEGYFRITTEYSSPLSFEQDIKIKRIRNSFSVYLDPFSKEPDGSDMNWAFIFEDVTKDDYEAQYKDSELCTSNNWGDVGQDAPGWITEESVRVAEYFYKEYESVDILLLSNGQIVEESEFSPEMTPELSIINKRKAQKPVIHWCKINGNEVLEETIIPGIWIPVIPVRGDEIDINGKITFEGIIRHAKDSQKMYNFFVSSETEAIALAPKAPFIVAEGQIPEEYKQQWETANKKTHAYLTYKPAAFQGQLVGAPQRNSYEPPVAGITNARLQASEDIKATTGIYDASLGAKSNENSGVAIQRRNIQSQTSNFHYIDNLTRAIKHAGRIIVAWIPEVYDTARVIRIIGEEDEQEIVKINQLFNHKGKDKTYDFSVGKYDVVVETGPNYATKRQEASAAMLELSKANPQLMGVAGDLLVRSLDIPGATQIAERIKKTLPPGMAEDDKTKKDVPPEVQAQLQQFDQMTAQLTETVKQQKQIIDTKSNELESKERIEFAKMENALVLKQMELQGAAANLAFGEELAFMRSRLDLLDVNQPMDAGQVPAQPPQQQPPQDFNGAGPEQALNQNEQPNQGELTPQM